MVVERVSLLSFTFLRTSCIALLLGALLSGCIGAKNPATGERGFALLGEVSEEKELEIGHEVNQQILKEYGYYDDPEVQEYVSKVGHSMVPHTHRPNIPYRFTVLDSPEINAFAIPGYVYVTRGILAMMNSEAELAGLLGHEIAHITARHSAQRMETRQTAGVIQWILERTVADRNVRNVANIAMEAGLMRFSRDDELEADRLGTSYAALTGYDPNRVEDLFRMLKSNEEFQLDLARKEGHDVRGRNFIDSIFSTHPENEDRIMEVRREAARHQSSEATLVRREEYLLHIEGIQYGPSELEGALRGNRYHHRVVDFIVEFPEGWTAADSPERLVAVSPPEDMQVSLQLLERDTTRPACDWLRWKHKKPAGLRARGTSGFDGCQARVQGEKAVAEVLVLEVSPKVFMALEAVATKGGMTTLDHRSAEVDQIFQSVRPLTRQEYDAAAPPVLRIVTAKPGDTYEGYAVGHEWDPHRADRLRALNTHYHPRKEPSPGERVKVLE